MGKAAWQALVGRYEREVPWLREAEAKEVCWSLSLRRGPHSLDIDAQSREILGEHYFGIRPAKGGNDMMSNLLSGLFGGGGGGGNAQGGKSPGRIASPGLD